MKIGIIDSGFDQKCNLVNNSIRHCINVGNGSIDNDTTDYNGHGTCVTLLLDEQCSNCFFYIVKILDQHNASTACQLIRALHILIDLDVNVINLSLGLETSHYNQDIQQIIKECCEKNIFIVCTNREYNLVNPIFNDKSVNIIKVLGAGNVRNNKKYIYSDIYYLRNMPRILPWKNNSKKFIGGNSFTVPIITGKLVNIIDSSSNTLEMSQIIAKLNHGFNQLTSLADIQKITQFTPCREQIKNKNLFIKICNLTKIYFSLFDSMNLSLIDIMSNSNCIDYIDFILSSLKLPIEYEPFNYYNIMYIENLSNCIQDFFIS